MKTETEEPSDIDLALAVYLGSDQGQATTAETGNERVAAHAWFAGFLACMNMMNHSADELTAELSKTLKEVDLYEG